MLSRWKKLLPSIILAGAAMVGACDDDGDPTGADTLTAPGNVQATAASNTSATVQFGAVSGADGYVIERAPGTAGEFALLTEVTATTHTDSGLEPGAVYRYRVAATRGTETSAFSAVAVVELPDLPTADIVGDITANRTLRADTVYTLGGFVHVTNGATLTIEPGTLIRGIPASALFIMRGAKIEAVGTAAAPIVMTSSRAVGQRQPGDWGGLVIVGNGIINRGPSVQLEGTGTVGGTVPGTNYAIDYGSGTNNADDSGHLEYVRIEFAGFGPVQDAELNSLTLAAVGSGTTIRYVQALGGLDDHFELFGGAVDMQYLVSYESGDDHFDMSEGYVGRIQYAIAFQSVVLTPRPGAGNVSNDPQGIENDGCAGANCFNGQNSVPLNIPLVANFTLIGTGPGVVPAGGGRGMMLRRGTGGYYVNGVIARWPAYAITLRDAATNQRITDGDLLLRNLLAAGNGATFEPDDPASSTRHYSVDAGANAIETNSSAPASLFTSLTASLEGLDWTPPAGSPAASGGLTSFTGAIATRAGTFVTPTSYRGAADPAGARWWASWTNYARN
ncbi:MAG TPA: fibronectin type III domain-containing protein [Longimicrobiales bacterium]|nr:fibronectin type III domain-containing protein [Longimicrobiales bacterium]